MMRQSYMSTITTTKTEKIEKALKLLKMYNSIYFKTIRYKLTASGNSNQSNSQLQT